MNSNVMESVRELANLNLDTEYGDRIWSYIRSYQKQAIYGNAISTKLMPNFVLVPTQSDVEKAKSCIKSTVILPGYPVTEFEYIATDQGKGAEILRSAFIQMIAEMREFLAAYREIGRPPFAMLEEKFSRLRTQLSLSLQEENSKLAIAFSDIPQPLGFIEDHIDYYFYLLPALNGDFDLWRKNRICKECGSIFFYKLERAQFCSTACQMRGAYKRRNEK